MTLGNISAAGFCIFDVVPTEGVDLTLSKDQKVMTRKDIDAWQSDESEKYADSPDHKQRQFLGKIFKSITCGSIKISITTWKLITLDKLLSWAGVLGAQQT